MTLDAQAHFDSVTEHHEMTVLRDDGLYRHVRFRDPSTLMYYFDLVTWPGYLAMAGDMGSYVFSRLEDMFEFFGGEEGINPHYWAEKLQAPDPDAVLRFSPERYRECVEGWLGERSEELGEGAVRELRDALLGDPPLSFEPGSAPEAMERLRDVGGTLNDDGEAVYVDASEWDLRDWDHRFLLACHAIAWGVRRYREAGG